MADNYRSLRDIMKGNIDDNKSFGGMRSRLGTDYDTYKKLKEDETKI